MHMKLSTALALALLVAASLAAGGCKTDNAVSAADCMQSFASRLNAGNFDLSDLTNSNAANHYLALTDLFWKTNFAGDGTFEYAMTDNTASATEAGVSFAFTLEEDGEDKYAIMTIVRNGVTILE